MSRHMVVVGGGTMGAGIAHAFLVAGAEVTIAESDPDAAEQARVRVRASLRKGEDRGKLPDGSTADGLVATLRTATSWAEVGDADLVVEAVPEDPALKRSVLVAAEDAAPNADLASNTSSLSIADLACELRRPDRFCGMHFFNPVPASALVEVVTHEGVADDRIERAVRDAESLGLTPVTVRDAPGFATSRLGLAAGLEAIRMLEEDVATASDIDTAMCLGYKWPIGPLRLGDLIGLDVRLAIAEYLAVRLGARFEPPQLLRDKVAAGELGKKAGQGFYTW
ncbi:MAG: 3-hydroxyacyl-CoA dehydrogenase family protein [Streptosporangiales bacterium]